MRSATNPDDLLADMNAIRIPPDRSARNYVELYGELTGNLTRPVLTLHAREDRVSIVHHESAYCATVQAAGATPSHFLAQAFIDTTGHTMLGGFTADQVLFAVRAMQGCLQTGLRPDPAKFPADLGFLPNFQPPPWPHVQPELRCH